MIRWGYSRSGINHIKVNQKGYKMRIGIVAVIYEEPEYQETLKCLMQLDCPIEYVDRQGIGSLAQAYNHGFDRITQKWDLDGIWLVSNITFEVSDFEKLRQCLIDGWDAVHPAFESDHQHIRPNDHGGKRRTGTREVKFLEFTAPMVNRYVFEAVRLNEKMPYWGHDLDWSYRAKQEGAKLGVCYDASVGHVYIRNNLVHPITRQRMSNRKRTDNQTTRELRRIYGANWRKLLY